MGCMGHWGHYMVISGCRVCQGCMGGLEGNVGILQPDRV